MTHQNPSDFIAKHSRIKIYILILIVYTLFFLPIVLNSGVYIDDVILLNSVISEIKTFKTTLSEISFNSFYDFLNSGRLYGLYFLYLIPYVFFNKVLEYQIFKAVFNLICVILFAVFIRILTKKIYNYWAFIFFTPIVFLVSLRDPLTTHGLSCQLCMIFIALTLIFYIIFHETRKKIYNYLSVFFFFWSFFYYEIGLCIIPLLIILATRFRIDSPNIDSSKISLKQYIFTTFSVCYKELRIHLIIFLLWALGALIVRIKMNFLYDGLEFGFNLESFLATWAINTFRALPLNILDYRMYLGAVNLWELIEVILLFIILYRVFVKILPKINFINYYRDLTLIGLALALIPSFLISLSSKYQVWVLQTNSAYLQIFIQFFGVSLLILLFIDYVIKNSERYNSKFKHKIFLNSISIMISLTISLTSIMNKNFTLYKNALGYNAIDNMEKALNSGIFNDVVKKPSQYFDIVLPTDFKYPIVVDDLLVKNNNKFLLNNFYLKNNKILMVSNRYIHGSFFNHNLDSHFLLVNGFSKKFFENLKKNPLEISLKNFYYVENIGNNFDLNDSYKANVYQNLRGYVILGKLNALKNQCSQKLSSSKCKIVYEITDVKIFINKEYSFKLSAIIDELNSRFGEKTISDPIYKIAKDLDMSKEGIIVNLGSKTYNIDLSSLFN